MSLDEPPELAAAAAPCQGSTERLLEELATFSSADSVLTTLTTSFCFDLLDTEKRTEAGDDYPDVMVVAGHKNQKAARGTCARAPPSKQGHQVDAMKSAASERQPTAVPGSDLERLYVERAPELAKAQAAKDVDDDAAYFNWRFAIDQRYQAPFAPTHENVAALALSRALPRHELASNLRRVFSSIVAGNVKEQGIAAVEARGPFQIRGEPDIMAALDALLSGFVAQQRMRLPGRAYRPCYEVVR